MKKKHGLILMAGFLFVLAAGPRMQAEGAESSVIETVAVKLTTTYGEAEEIPEPVIEVSTKGCLLGDVQYRTDYEKWKPGRKVRIEITVNAEDGKYFPASLNRSECKVTGADFVSARALDDTSLQVKVDYRPVTVLGETQKAGWSDSSKKRAVWKPVEYAPGYTLVLYGDSKVVKRMTVETASVDLSEYMDDMDKTYYYEVKAVPVTSDQKKYLKEGEVIASTDQEFDWEDFEEEQEKTQRPQDGGAVRGDSYVMPDGSRATNTWKKISGKWYFFDGNGNRAKGWLYTGDRWYYMDQDGVMCTGWVFPDGRTWYYLNENGEMQTGWVESAPGVWYHLGPDGGMQTGWICVNDKWYYLREDGSMVANATVDGRYVGADGAAYQ